MELEGEKNASILIVSWGSTYGSIKTAIDECSKEGIAIALLHLRYLNPLPNDLSVFLMQFSTVLVAELNQGQLCREIRSKYLVNAKSITQCNGKSFSVSYLLEQLRDLR